MASNDQQLTTKQPQKCPSCKDMYGSPKFDDFCSKCYKKAKQTLKELVKECQKIEQKDSEKPQVPQKIAKNIIIQEKKFDGEQPIKRKYTIDEETPKKSEVGRCSKCRKKTGLLGYECKHCQSQFCKFHRLPEEHECEADFISMGKKKIKIENPIIVNKKIQHI